VAGAEECGAGAGKDLEEEKRDNQLMNNNNDRQHTTIKQNTVEVGKRRSRWRTGFDPSWSTFLRYCVVSKKTSV
jgi:hypothetical protein